MKSMLVYILILLVNVSCFGVMTEKEKNDEIVFVRIKMVDGKPAGMSYDIVPGKLKTPKVIDSKPNDIFYEIMDDAGSVISEGTVIDQSQRSYEYVDEEGNLKSAEIKTNSTEIAIRFNNKNNVSRINLYKIPDDESLFKIKEKYIPLATYQFHLK